VNDVVVIETVRRRDGKLYPPEPLAEAELRRIRGLVHAFHCRDRQSIREVQQALLSYAVRRSVGAIWRDLHRYTCSLPRCPAVPKPPDPPRAPAGPEPVRAAVHQGDGGLTGMIGRG
jgi:hypothetical protein